MRRIVYCTYSGLTSLEVAQHIGSFAAACYHGTVQSEWNPKSGNAALSPHSEAVSIADEFSQRGLELLANGELSAAVKVFRQAIAADPSYTEAHHGLIRALRDGGEFEAAIAAALALTLVTPMDPLAHTSLSIALQKAGHIPEAESAAARARILEWKQQLADPSLTGASEVL